MDAGDWRLTRLCDPVTLNEILRRNKKIENSWKFTLSREMVAREARGTFVTEARTRELRSRHAEFYYWPSRIEKFKRLLC